MDQLGLKQEGESKMKLFLAFIIAFTSSFGFASTKTILKGDIVEGIVGIQELIGAKGHFEKNAIGWNGFDDGASTSPVDGTGGATITTTCTRTTSSPIDGDGSLLITKGGANYQGEGCSLDFTVPSDLSGSVLRGSFDYAIASGTYADDAIQVWIYNATDGVLIQPAPTKIKNHSLVKQAYDFEFQSTYSTSSKTYRVILHIAASDSNAYTIKIDGWKLGAYPKNYGSPVTDWVSYTPTLKGQSNGLAYTNATTIGRYRRDGDSVEIQIETDFSGAPGTGTGYFIWSLPSGLAVDTSKLTGSGTNQNVMGVFQYYDASATWTVGTSHYSSTSSSIVALYSGASVQAGPTAPVTTAAGDIATISIKLPILGWSSSVVMSSDAATTVVAASAYKNGNQTGINPNASAVKLTLDTAAFDRQGAFDTVNNRYVVKTPGDYNIDALVYVAGTNVLANYYDVRLYKNGVLHTYGAALFASASGAFALPLTTKLSLVAGDYLELYLFGTGNNSVSTLTVSGGVGVTRMNIERISGPSQIAASDSYQSRYTSNAANNITNGAYNFIDFEDKDFDSHNSVSGTGSGNVTTTNTGWKFTSNISGVYSVSSVVGISFPTSTTVYTFMAIYVNGTAVSYGTRASGTTASTSGVINLSISDDIRLLSGDRVEIAVFQESTATRAMSGVSGANRVSIKRVGNY